MWSDNDKRRIYQKNLYEERKKWAFNFLGNKCAYCGTKKDLTMDHKNPNDKSYNVTRALRWKSKRELIKELKKCQLLCKMCHIKKTFKEGSRNIGEASGGAKLKNNDIINILKDSRSSRKIAKDYGISHVTVLNIKNKKNWKHIGE